MSEVLAAGVRLQQELDRALEAFAVEHAELVRLACQVSVEQIDLGPVVLATMFGHVIERMMRVQGRHATESLAHTLIEQFEALADRGASVERERQRLH